MPVVFFPEVAAMYTTIKQSPGRPANSPATLAESISQQFPPSRIARPRKGMVGDKGESAKHKQPCLLLPELHSSPFITFRSFNHFTHQVDSKTDLSSSNFLPHHHTVLYKSQSTIQFTEKSIHSRTVKCQLNMQTQLFLLPLVLLLVPLAGIWAVPQDSQGRFGTVEETVERLDNDVLPNITCSALTLAVRATIKAHPDWRDWLDQMRRNQTQFVENCEEGLDKNDTEVRSFLDYQRDLLNCPDAHAPTSVVAIVFIILFILALIGLIIVSILYYRK